MILGLLLTRHRRLCSFQNTSARHRAAPRLVGMKRAAYIDISQLIIIMIKLNSFSSKIKLIIIKRIMIICVFSLPQSEPGKRIVLSSIFLRRIRKSFAFFF